MKEIPLFGKYGAGKVALVDDEDFEKFGHYRWHASLTKGKVFAVRAKHVEKSAARIRRQQKVSLHREIMQPIPEGMEVDHANHNMLDCRKANLRLCTHSQNNTNRRRNLNVASLYRGVEYSVKQYGGVHPYCARLVKNGKVHYLGTFTTAEEAAQAYDVKAIEMHGEFASLNFPKIQQ